MMATDGRCKTLDEKADGYVRAEDCIVLIIEILDLHSPAKALFSASAVNQVCLFVHELHKYLAI